MESVYVYMYVYGHSKLISVSCPLPACISTSTSTIQNCQTYGFSDHFLLNLGLNDHFQPPTRISSWTEGGTGNRKFIWSGLWYQKY